MVVVETDGDFYQENFDIESNAKILLFDVEPKDLQAFQLIPTVGAAFAAHGDDFIEFFQNGIVRDFFIFGERDELLSLRITGSNKCVDESKSYVRLVEVPHLSFRPRLHRRIVGRVGRFVVV